MNINPTVYMTKHIECCLDAYVPGDTYISDQDIEASISNAGLVSQSQITDLIPKMRLFIHRQKQLPQNMIVRVNFLNGEPYQKAWVEKTIMEKLQPHINIQFRFGTFNVSEVRIDFTPGSSWSFIGTDFTNGSLSMPTMQLGWLDIPPGQFTWRNITYNVPPTTRTNLSGQGTVVVHEFLHTCSAIHEHQNPKGKIQWDLNKVYAFYGGPPNFFTRDEVDTNILQKYDQNITNGSEFDPLSIMLYPIPADLTLNGFSVKMNPVMSKTDIEWIRMLYPPNPTAIPPSPTQPPSTPVPQPPSTPVPQPPVLVNTNVWTGVINGKNPGESLYCGPKGTIRECPRGYSCSKGRFCIITGTTPPPSDGPIQPTFPNPNTNPNPNPTFPNTNPNPNPTFPNTNPNTNPTFPNTNPNPDPTIPNTTPGEDEEDTGPICSIM